MRANLLLARLVCCVSLITSIEMSVVAQSDLIRDENQKPGALDWQLTRVRLDKNNYRSPWIEGYCSKQSVLAGESLDIMVSTDPPVKFKIEVFRTGYYGGKGARLMTTLGPLQGTAQPIHPWVRNGCVNATGSRPPR